MNKILDYLLNNGLIDEIEKNEIIERSNKTGELIEDILLNKRIVQDSELLEIKSIIFNKPFVNIYGNIIKKDILNIITKDLAENYKCIVFNKDGNDIYVAMVDPENYNAISAIEFATRENDYNIKYFVTTISSINYAIKQYSNLTSEVSKEIDNVSIKLDNEFMSESIDLNQDNIKNSPVSRIVSTIIKHAIEEGSSDIHIEPTKDDVRVRYRVDGVLYTSVRLPKHTHNSVVTRIKVIAGLKIDENRIPQDGRVRLSIGAKFYDFRISIIPISDGEKIVMRILDNSKKAPTLEDLGVESRNLDLIKNELKSSSGIIVVCGPTGSGKSTTLFSVLSMLNKDDVNIVTLEDPVEYVIDGVNHSQVRPEIGYSFASGIRSFLRQDPDVIMVGEIRDNETAELCVHAGLTGHLVLTTLHTNSAIGAIPRLFDMKVEPFLLSSSLNLIISQRLVRKVCNNCKTELIIDENILNKAKEKLLQINPEYLKKYGINSLNNIKFYKGKGCSMCSDTGYKGRLSVMEVVKITDDIKQLIEKNSSIVDLERELSKQNFISIEQDAIAKALKGDITLSDAMEITNLD